MSFARRRLFEVDVTLAMDQGTATSTVVCCFFFKSNKCDQIMKHFILEGTKGNLTNAFSSVCEDFLKMCMLLFFLKCKAAFHVYACSFLDVLKI